MLYFFIFRVLKRFELSVTVVYMKPSVLQPEKYILKQKFYAKKWLVGFGFC